MKPIIAKINVEIEQKNCCLSLEIIKDLSVRIVSEMVIQGLVVDCTDTDNTTEFDIQDIVVNELCKLLNIENE
jgi:hypothetical protein